MISSVWPLHGGESPVRARSLVTYAPHGRNSGEVIVEADENEAILFADIGKRDLSLDTMPRFLHSLPLRYRSFDDEST